MKKTKKTFGKKRTFNDFVKIIQGHFFDFTYSSFVFLSFCFSFTYRNQI